ncbi:hypothetical protein PIB30_032702 [Stylosanthes scabra]|uniref:Uncharacterized protein n=1 Tax=Stylosanthes scabra TaxID=79078 RepID=A0ABU6RCI9_9FABA|nr:hypothetical protein [Stylosanthes scabra]
MNGSPRRVPPSWCFTSRSVLVLRTPPRQLHPCLLSPLSLFVSARAIVLLRLFFNSLSCYASPFLVNSYELTHEFDNLALSSLITLNPLSRSSPLLPPRRSLRLGCVLRVMCYRAKPRRRFLWF